MGNSNYTKISALENPKNDAELIAATLKDVGFEVTMAMDVNLLAMNRAVRKFSHALRRAGKDAVGLFYYAGHGVQARGENYLIPLGAQVDSEVDLTLEAVSTSDVMTHLDGAGNTLNLVVLDACRNNPYKSSFRSGSRGLARVQAASGTLIAYSAGPGQVAADGRQQNSPYTLALAQSMRRPGLTVEQVFKAVRINVENETAGRQTPWEESSLRGEFFFVPSDSIQRPSLIETKPVFEDRAFELSFWNSISRGEDVAAFRAYLEKFPTGTFASLARLKIDELDEPTPAATAPTLPETSADEPIEDLRPSRALIRDIQNRLSALKCNPGKPDGIWGNKGRRALRALVSRNKLTLASLEPSQSLLEKLQDPALAVCTVACGRNHKLVGGRCVAKTPAVKVKKAKPKPKKAAVKKPNRVKKTRSAPRKKKAVVRKQPAARKGSCKKNRMLRHGCVF